MGDLSTFFKTSEASLGVFHPLDYTIATFATFEAAKKAYEALLYTGVAGDEVMLVDGSEMLTYLRNFRNSEGFWGDLMRPLSRFLGAEANNSDLAVTEAQHGAGFIAILCVTEEKALQYMATMKPFKPSAADWYIGVGIRSLITD